MSTAIAASNQVEILSPYVIEEFGGVFVYLPSLTHSRPEDRDARACLEDLQVKRLISSNSWHKPIDYINELNRKQLPTLFDGRIKAFDIYRLDRNYWRSLLAR